MTTNKEETANGKQQFQCCSVEYVGPKMLCALGEPLFHPATLFANTTLVASACEIIKWTTMMRLDFFSRYFILFYLLII